MCALLKIGYIWFDSTMAMKLKPPKNVKLYETPISTHWFNEQGIFCAVSKKVERSVENYLELMDLYKSQVNSGEKLCMLADASDAMPQTKETREFLLAEMPKYIKAQAIIVDKMMESSLNSTVLRLSWQGFPVMIFTDAEEAIEWLLEHKNEK